MVIARISIRGMNRHCQNHHKIRVNLKYALAGLLGAMTVVAFLFLRTLMFCSVKRGEGG
jgi:hypothetical protein